MCRAITLIETLLAAAVIGVVLAVVTLGVATVRSDLKRSQVVQLLATLDQAMSAYHQTTGQWPAAPAAKQGGRTSAEDDGSADRILTVLAAEPTSRAVLDTIEPMLQVKPIGETEGTTPFGMVQDAWARPLRCLTADSASPLDREAVAVNAGRPIFVSAGPDGQFGASDLAAAADNLRSDRR